MKTRYFNVVAANVGVVAAYFAAVMLNPWLGNQRLDFSPLFPASGVGMAAMLVAGRVPWRAVLAGAFAGVFVSFLKAGMSWWVAAAFGLAVAGGETLQLLLAAWLTRLLANGSEAFDRPQTMLGFSGIVCACMAINPTLGFATARFLGAGTAPAESWLTWWLADVVSVLVLAPCLVTWWRKPWPLLPFRRKGELTILLLLLVFIWEFISSGMLLERTHAPLLYFLVVPMLLWAALRLGEHGSSLAVLVLACAGNLTAIAGRDMFLGQDRNTSFLMLEGFLGVMAIMTCTLAADAGQRQRAQEAHAASEQRYRELFDTNPLPIWVYDSVTLRFLAVNKAAVEQYGYGREEFLQMRASDIELAHDGQNVSRTGIPREGFHQRRHRNKQGEAIDVEVKEHPLLFEQRPAILAISNDITEQKRAEERAALFSSVSQGLSSARTRREAAQIIVDAADTLFGWDACLFEQCSGARETLTPILRIDTIDGTRKQLELETRPPGPLALAALRKGASLVLRRQDEGFPPGSVPFGDVARPSLSAMTVPLRKDNQILGVLSIQSYAAEAYTDSDLSTLQALADVCGGAFERIRIEEEITRVDAEGRRHLEELKTLFDVAPVGIALAHDPECREISINAACALMFGLEPALRLKLEGDSPFELRRAGKPMDPEEFPMRSAARRGTSVSGEEVEVALKDGRVLNCYTLASPLYDDAGRVRGSLGIFVDLTERKKAEQEILRLNAELERRVHERTMQLEAINKELEAFSYSVSHDLRAPLRSIRGFSEVLLERYSSTLDPRGQEFLRRACESCAHMDRLIEDLLKLSRVGRSELQHGPVDLSALVESIGLELQRTHPEHPVEFIVAPALQALGDERLLRVALENLLRNAWKFTGKRQDARVEFGQLAGTEQAYYVRDNGAGFDMTYAGKLFGVFQRLHTASEFPGTGVGLATVQRIINRHGGRAWATGAVDQGACFYFTLPSSQEEQ
jgi:PAS domain S-box-containing protein